MNLLAYCPHCMLNGPKMNCLDCRVEAAAHCAHEMNRQWCFLYGDESQPAWPDAPEWQKSSARVGVKAILNNPAQTPEASHVGWFEQKFTEGWRYGKVKDPEARLHPCMVPYHELPPQQRAKDSIFIAVVKGALGL